MWPALHIIHSALVQALCLIWPECPIDALEQQGLLMSSLAILKVQALSRRKRLHAGLCFGLRYMHRSRAVHICIISQPIPQEVRHVASLETVESVSMR